MYKHVSVLLVVLLLGFSLSLSARTTYNFNGSWRTHLGDSPGSTTANSFFGHPEFDDSGWKPVTLPHTFNEDDAFRVPIHHLTDTVAWYRKHFFLSGNDKDKRVFIEFEGVRQAAEIMINGYWIGRHENGVMAFGFDLTPYIKFGQDNVITVRIDNDWSYKERKTGVTFQWQSRAFNANYGGISKNVWLHVVDKVHQTLPLYSSLGTVGTYIYADRMDIQNRIATIYAESEVENSSEKEVSVSLQMIISDQEGKVVGSFEGYKQLLKPSAKTVLSAQGDMDNVHFWSWGYGYLYNVTTRLVADNKIKDEVTTRTGFRKVHLSEGKIYLNDRCIMLHGFAQRSTNEWPGVGQCVPAWMSDYSNEMIVNGNGNMIRWMHITPWKQDVESCDRVGLIQIMPAGDAEYDTQGREWEQRLELMRDAIIYNRNSPSILFYESGNREISASHMNDMKVIRDTYDPFGGRAIGSREMLDIREAEYGGEMLYINKSASKPLWSHEYCRDEGLRNYWDEYSYPYHKEGDGPQHGKVPPNAYNHNQDRFTVELVNRWYDYWRERPGTGKRVSSGGAKIIFSDTQTHSRGAENYRRSGVVDALRIPKDAYFAHQVMWDGWVDTENPRLHIVGHWNYDNNVVKPVYVVANTDSVALFLNGKAIEHSRQDYHFLFTFDKVAFAPGRLEAIGYNDGKEVAKVQLETTGPPYRVKLSTIEGPQGLMADGADMAIIHADMVDKEGRRCLLADNMLSFTVSGEAEWRGGIAKGPENYALATSLPLVCGQNRVLLRSTTTPGAIRLICKADGVIGDTITLNSQSVVMKNGLMMKSGRDYQRCVLTRGETPSTASYTDLKRQIKINSAKAGSNSSRAYSSFDDNEHTAWISINDLDSAYISYQLAEQAHISEVVLKLHDFRNISYPLEVSANGKVIHRTVTDKSLGYVHLTFPPAFTDQLTVKLFEPSFPNEGYGQIIEYGDENRDMKDYSKDNCTLSIYEIDILE
ncbi:sugar-binding domain-containing protein [Bacteroides sp. 51]|uniref:glycoside hydrolase family 2 protein n=1 Tax=Bacteroides sp. 51 TaxID=2302938 RepID=UPI0013D8DFD6|nr:sugar-binding domain-containing protein [Bacteroides sp. 51]NDV84025.1 glycoside hydrolase family 2 protein [Bacteroides sp. 51]